MKPQNQLHSELLSWYHANSRHLPWRTSNNPYLVWLSEIILQQTRVNQGLPYYESFVSAYPSVNKLASATEDEVLKKWQGLGYYSRARNMHKTAKIIANNFKGVFPKSSKHLLKLPGIGEYTAAAIASFCFNEKVAVLDGNVFRVLSRLNGIESAINSTVGKKEFKIIADEFLNKVNPASHNQAMMELGALICTPSKPDCLNCPFSSNCIALRLKKIHELPVKHPSKAKRTRYFNYLVFKSSPQNVFLTQRKGQDIWKELHQFPLVETQRRINDFNLLSIDNQSFADLNFKINTTPTSIIAPKHILTHQIIHATFWTIPISNVQIGENCDIFELELNELESKYAVPVLIKNMLVNLV